jgi:hypothetical protein
VLRSALTKASSVAAVSFAGVCPEARRNGESVERGYNTELIRDPIAPTEFPTGWSAAQEFRAQALSVRATCSPQEEDTVCSSRPEAATSLGLPPNVLGLGLTIGQ